MSKLSLTLASGDYDRVRPLWDGSMEAEGLDLNTVLLPVEEIFFRMSRYQDFDASEMSLSSYLISKSRGTPRFVAIPAFPSRKFRHADVYINTASNIKRPEDLRGGRIGSPEYQMTACVWMRGILEEFYGVKAADVQWFSGGTERPGREERLKLTLPPEFTLNAIEKTATLFEMLKNGEIDAVFTARVPSPFVRGEAWIGRLFPDAKAVEQDYFRQTGIFPIMHTVVINEAYYEKHPWVAQSLYKAYCKAKDINMERINSSAALPFALPWFNSELDATTALMGRDFWPYGWEANKQVIEKLISYMKIQGLLPKDFNPTAEELFVPSTLSTSGV